MHEACIMDFQRSLNHYVALIEFSYNNNFHAMIDIAPYKILYGKNCKSPVHKDEIGE